MLYLIPDRSGSEIAAAEDAVALRNMMIDDVAAGCAFPSLTANMVEVKNETKRLAAVDKWVDTLRNAEIVMWRSDLYWAALEQAQSGVFVGTVIPNEILPRVPQLWVIFGDSKFGLTQANNARISSILLYPIDSELQVVLHAHPLIDGLNALSVLPFVVDKGSLQPGRRIVTQDESEIYACLSFMNSTVATTEQLNVGRPAQRRMKRTGKQITDLRIVRLRRKERDPHEHSHLTDREYQCQWLVRAHVRRPSPQMKEQRPVWVGEYVKGPQDKPLKPPTRKVIVVDR